MSHCSPEVQWWEDQIPYIHQPLVKPEARVLLAHGAGAGMEHPTLSAIAEAWLELGVEVVRFEFPYMARRRTEGVKAPPNKIHNIVVAWQAALAHWAVSHVPTVLVGKSMGGRAASLLVSDEGFNPERWNVAACVCLGYPFHPPKKTAVLRVEHLPRVKAPTLIIQGTRDAFGKPEEVADYELGANVSVKWQDHCDHDFQPLKRSGVTQAQALREVVATANEFVQLQGRQRLD